MWEALPRPPPTGQELQSSRAGGGPPKQKTSKSEVPPLSQAHVYMCIMYEQIATQRWCKDRFSIWRHWTLLSTNIPIWNNIDIATHTYSHIQNMNVAWYIQLCIYTYTGIHEYIRVVYSQVFGDMWVNEKYKSPNDSDRTDEVYCIHGVLYANVAVMSN